MYLQKLLKFVVPTFAVLYFVWSVSSAQFAWFTQLSVIGALLVVSWTVGYFLFDCFNTERISASNKAVLVTGCDTGFGNELVKRLDGLGFHVFAGVLFPYGTGAQDLQRSCSTRLHLLKMDVTKQEDITSAVDHIKQSKIPLWAIVNNAGIGFGANFDWGKDIEPYQKLFDVNVFGIVRVTKSCVNLLRKSKGRVVNVASLAGRIAPNNLAHYGMAKHSVRVFSDVIRRELYNDGVQVVNIEPIFYKTEIINIEGSLRQWEKLYNESSEETKKHYGPLNKKAHEGMTREINDNSRKNLSEVTDAMVNAITLEHPKAFYRCCGYLDIGFWAVSHLPEILLDQIVLFGHSRRLAKYSK